jgi:peptidoglycan/xylan/chitin deacetylase (PgdA/CDA1 family)
MNSAADLATSPLCQQTARYSPAMPPFDRRAMLSAIALGVLATTMAPGAAADPVTPRGSRRHPAPDGLVEQLPGGGRRVAFTIDDGTNTDVVAAFARFCRDTGTRMTFFVNGANPSWTDNARALRPMVESGQIQMGNHTWSHPYITRLSPKEVADQIRRNADFLVSTYGVDGTPFFRPPYGRHTPDNDRVAADLGYHTITKWTDTVGDAKPITERELVAGAARAFQPGGIVLAHANLPTITRCYPQIIELIRSRNLQTVTLNDVFS